MADDFRLKVGFFSHPKTRKLRRRHGDAALICLMRLWEFAAIHRPKGTLHDMTREDVVDVSGWHGDGEFVDSLVEFGLLDVDEWYKIHDWREHNGYVYFSEERSQSARKAAEAKWRKVKGSEE